MHEVAKTVGIYILPSSNTQETYIASYSTIHIYTLLKPEHEKLVSCCNISS